MSYDNIEKEYVSTSCCEILKEFHCLLNEAEELYEKSDETIDTKVVKSICSAIRSLEEAFDLGGRGEEKENNAYKILNKSGCSNDCNKDSTKCKELYNKAQEQFSLESDYLVHALNSLKDAQKDIENSIDVRKIGYNLKNQYEKCVH